MLVWFIDTPSPASRPWPRLIRGMPPPRLSTTVGDRFGPAWTEKADDQVCLRSLRQRREATSQGRRPPPWEKVTERITEMPGSCQLAPASRLRRSDVPPQG